MTFEDRLDGWARGWRGPVLAALVALIAGLPGLLAMPVLDRDEARFAEASAQMLETRDFTMIRFQEEPRFKKPVGIYWLQALSAAVFSSAEARDIRPYRIPSILGAMLAAAACAWGAMAFLRPGPAMAAGVALASSILLSTEAFIGKTDALLCGAVTLSMAALGRIYLAAEDNGPPAGRRTRLWFWLGMAVSILVKGPIGPMVAGLTLLALWAADRKAGWMKTLGWDWGLILILAVVGPWALAITVATDGSFWGVAVAGDLAPKLAGGQEGHGAPPGVHSLLAPLLMFPTSLLLPAGLVLAWRGRKAPAIRFALAWLIPTWLVFELAPTKLVHYPLPAYGALAWLIAASLAPVIEMRSRIVGSVLVVLAAVLFSGAFIYGASLYGGTASLIWAGLTAAMLIGAAGTAIVLTWRGRAMAGLLAACALGTAGHGLAVAGLAPGLRTLWIAPRLERALQSARIDPRSGATPGPVAIAGISEPSLVFTLGTHTELGDGATAAAAIGEGRPAAVEGRQDAQFQAALTAAGVQARPAGVVTGLNYSNGDDVILRLYAPMARPGARP